MCTAGDIASAVEPPLRLNRDFLRLWTGGAVSGLGSAITTLAYPLLALSVTSSAGQAGLLGLVTMAAGTVMRLPAGALIDRVPLRRILVGSDGVRLVMTTALTVSVLAGRLALWHLLVVAVVNAFAGVFNQIAHSVAVRHIVSATQLPQAFAVNEGRSHAISLVGQPVGGFLYGVNTVLPLVADALSFAASAIVSATLKSPLRPSSTPADRLRFRDDVLTGMAFLLKEPFLRSILLAATGFQFVFTAATFAVIANFTQSGTRSAELGGLFAIAAVGGILGSIAAPRLQARFSTKTLVLILGWTAAVAFVVMTGIDVPVVAGVLLGCVYFVGAPANGALLAAQVRRTPAHLQGRVMAASFLIAGLAAPLGPPVSGLLLDLTSPATAFACIAAASALITVAVHANRALSTSPTSPAGA